MRVLWLEVIIEEFFKKINSYKVYFRIGTDQIIKCEGGGKSKSKGFLVWLTELS